MGGPVRIEGLDRGVNSAGSIMNDMNESAAYYCLQRTDSAKIRAA